jgi:hypothetical protein
MTWSQVHAFGNALVPTLVAFPAPLGALAMAHVCVWPFSAPVVR